MPKSILTTERNEQKHTLLQYCMYVRNTRRRKFVTSMTNSRTTTIARRHRCILRQNENEGATRLSARQLYPIRNERPAGVGDKKSINTCGLQSEPSRGDTQTNTSAIAKQTQKPGSTYINRREKRVRQRYGNHAPDVF